MQPLHHAPEVVCSEISIKHHAGIVGEPNLYAGRYGGGLFAIFV
jgi:hypothetical protein